MRIPRERQPFRPIAHGTIPNIYSRALNDLAKVQALGISRAMLDVHRQVNALNIGAYNRIANDLHRWQSVRTSLLPSSRLMNEIAISLPRMEKITQASISSALELNRNIEARARFAIDDSVVKSLAKTHLDFSKSYAGLLSGFNESVSESVRLRPAILTLPPVEHYNASRLMVEIFPPEDSDDVLDLEDESEDASSGLILETEYGIENLLSELDNRLIAPWRGIGDVISSGGADRLRQSAASMRELLTHVVHQLAPDNEVSDWTTDPNHFYNGHPTRRARFLYICQDSDHGDFSKFLERDVDACLGMFDVFQTGVHSLESPFSERQILALKVRMEGTIRLLFETART